ncbi:MAG: PEGA domain-containing protein, partial [Kofleriaceae bacterium]|nr:PEGA domain-containing protein [Kofleriaceae bacterium]
DIYALGILLFQMMTGLLPFDGETMGEVLVKQVTQLPPPPRGLNPSIPPSVEQILLRCLAKNPDARFPTMIALREALLDPEAYLRNSPPMAPARSLAPGEIKVDAKTVMAYAAQQQQSSHATQIGMMGAPLPLAAPPPSLPGNAGAKTMIADGAQNLPPRAPPAPEMIAPAQPKMNTMRIATPLGYSSRPPRKMWPIVLVLALLLGLGGGAFAVAYFGKKDGGSSSEETNGGSAEETAGGSDASGSSSAATAGSGGQGQGSAVAVAPPDAQVTAIDAGSATNTGAVATKTAVIVLDSTPPGAEVVDADKKSYGKTPAQLTLPISDLPLTFELKLAGYRKKTKEIVVTGNAVVQVTLDRLPAQNTGTPKGSGKGSSKGGPDELMNPDDL